MAESFFTEFKRRNVFKVGVAYLVLAWVVIQVTQAAVPALLLPEWVNSLVFYLGAIGFPFALFFAWVFEITPDGIKRESEITPQDSIAAHTGRKLDIIIIALLVIGLSYFVYDSRFNDQPSQVVQDIKVTDSVNQTTDQESENTSIAVLPFVNRSNNADDQFFVDGIQDDLLTKLAKIHNIKVISRTSVMEYRDTTKKIPQIAKELGVANILEGGVQRSGDHIRINAQLIHAATDEHLWAETYDKELNVDNVFAIQTEIAIEIAKAMKTTLTPEEKQQIAKPLTDNLIALDFYMKGLGISDVTTQGFETVSDNFKRAIEIDPQFAVAHAGLASIEMNKYWFDSRDSNIRQRAWKSIQRSRAIDDNTAELFAAEAAYYYWGFRDFTKALVAAEKAVAIAPNSITANDVRGFILRRLGRYDESIKALEYAASINPRTTYALQENAETLLYLSRYEETAEYIKRIELITPGDTDIDVIKGLLSIRRDGDYDTAIKIMEPGKNGNSYNARTYWQTLILADRIDEALEFAKTSTQLVSSGNGYASNEMMTGLSHYLLGNIETATPFLQLSLNSLIDSHALKSHEHYQTAVCLMYAALGDADKADVHCQNAVNDKRDAYAYPGNLYNVIQAYAALGNSERALDLLEQLFVLEIHPSLHQLKRSPFLKNLHGNPRYEAIINNSLKSL